MQPNRKKPSKITYYDPIQILVERVIAIKEAPPSGKYAEASPKAEGNPK